MSKSMDGRDGRHRPVGGLRPILSVGPDARPVGFGKATRAGKVLKRPLLESWAYDSIVFCVYNGR